MIIGVSTSSVPTDSLSGRASWSPIFSVRTWFASEKGRRVWENAAAQSPVVGPLTAQFAMARFCRMLGTLLGAGVPLVQGAERRPQIHRQPDSGGRGLAIHRARPAGRPLGQSLADCRDLFPGSVLEMVSVAEESGRLDQELVRIANVTEADLDRQLKTAVALAEPLMLFLHRRVHRHHFHRHAHPHLFPARHTS
jgi:type II secretory pathway component PulF